MAKKESPASVGEAREQETKSVHPVTPEERYRMISENAYFRAEKRGFEGGDLAEDWLRAEAEIDRMLKEQGRLPAMTPEEIQERVQGVIASDPATISAQVRAITLDALTRGSFDTDALRKVSAVVIEAARAGAAPLGDRGGQALKEAIRGLDDALAGAAEAAHLAIEEAAGRTSEFSRQGLKRAMDDLAALQAMFVETLQEAARKTQGVAKATLSELAEHARSSGSAVGQRVKTALDQLTETLQSNARTQAQKGAEALRHEAALFASLAAGLLQGVADRMMPKKTGKDD